MRHLPLISFAVVARDAALCLPGLLADFIGQDYPADRTELILVDSCSRDNTRAIMEAFAINHPERAIKVLDNKGLILSTGTNVALQEASGEVFIRLDAHARFPKDFLRRNSEHLMTGEKIVGGAVLTIMPEQGRWKRLLALAEQCKFGGSPAAARNSGRSRYIDTLGYPAFNRSVFAKVGGFDERLVRNQDNEVYFRMKRAGFRFFFGSEIRSFHSPRSTLRSLLQQKYQTGVWIGLTLGVSPRCFGVRHFVPVLFVTALLVSVLLIVLLGWMLPLAIIGSTYLFGAVFFSLHSYCSAPKDVKLACAALPVMFFLMHIAYGVGTWIGLLKLPSFVYRNRNYKLPFPIGIMPTAPMD